MPLRAAMKVVDDYYASTNPAVSAAATTAVVMASIYVIKKLDVYGRWKQREIRKQFRAKTKARQEERERDVQALTQKLTGAAGVLMTPYRQDIVDMSPAALLSGLKNNTLSAVQVLHAFQAKAIEVHRKCNCIVNFIKEAEDWAIELDRNPSRELPLHGLPVSIKENWAVANYDVTVGAAKFIGQPMKEDSENVVAFKKLGAIPFCRTNIPQTLFSYGSSNPVYGTTAHPTHPDRTPGGSSSGEACLIAAGGSVLGLGSDIAGSVRIPAHFCGIVGYKPTAGKFSMRVPRATLAGCPGFLSTAGLMGRDVEIVVTAARHLFKDGWMAKLDPLVSPIPWKEHVFRNNKTLRIGYWDTSDLYPTIPACKRALSEAAKALEDAGHEIVPFSLDKDEVRQLSEALGKILLSDQGKALSKVLKNEEVSPSISNLVTVATMPHWIRVLLTPIARLLSSRTLLIGATQSHELWEILFFRSTFINKLTDKWQDAHIDVWLTPANPTVAMDPDVTSKLISLAFYTAIFSMFNFPAGVVPVTKVTAEDDEHLKDYDTQGDMILRKLKENAMKSEGLPVGVQLVGLPWQDELVLRAMKELESALKKK